MKHYLDTLNPAQRAAVEATEGPVLVLAGAGTGKTRVLTTRIAHIIESRLADADHILSVTFTNKAAREMTERIAKLVGERADKLPWVGTFHAISARILRSHAKRVGLRPNYIIIDQGDQEHMLRVLIKEKHLDNELPLAEMIRMVEDWQAKGLNSADVDKKYPNNVGAPLYREYQRRLKAENSIDFGGLINDTILLLSENDDVAQEYRNQFRYILVDEYQDTNIAQSLWLRQLVGERQNICCVGDEDQSIYGWRGAEIDNILSFEANFPGAKIFKLEQNYRSTGHILGAASGIIANNTQRIGKTLFTDRAPGEKISVIETGDSNGEAYMIADEIELLRSGGHPLKEIAILVRTGMQMREIEKWFTIKKLPYRVVGSPKFYERSEIRDSMAYLRCIANPDSDTAFSRIINTPSRGLGERTIDRMREHAKKSKIPMVKAAEAMLDTNELAPKQSQALRKFLGNLEYWSKLKDERQPHELAERVLKESGYFDWALRSWPEDGAARVDNLYELIEASREYRNLDDFLESAAVTTSSDSGESGEAVSLMTLHAAKGLEFETVFLPGWESGLFPHKRCIEEGLDEGLEEERRLAYVGLTRAKSRVKISYARKRAIRGSSQRAEPSMFISCLSGCYPHLLNVGCAQSPE